MTSESHHKHANTLITLRQGDQCGFISKERAEISQINQFFMLPFNNIVDFLNGEDESLPSISVVVTSKQSHLILLI